MLPKIAANIIVAVVSLAWVANYVARFVIPQYTPDSYIDGIFTTVIGAAFALSSRSRDNSGKRGDDEK